MSCSSSGGTYPSGVRGGSYGLRCPTLISPPPHGVAHCIRLGKEELPQGRSSVMADAKRHAQLLDQGGADTSPLGKCGSKRRKMRGVDPPESCRVESAGGEHRLPWGSPQDCTTHSIVSNERFIVDRQYERSVVSRSARGHQCRDRWLVRRRHLGHADGRREEARGTREPN